MSRFAQAAAGTSSASRARTPLVDVVADGAHVLDGAARRVYQHPVEVALPGVDGVGLVPLDGSELYVVSQSQMRLLVDQSKADALYVYYCFRDPALVELIQSRAIVTGVPHINLSILGDLPIPYRSLPEQRGIAEVLGALDDKIEANKRVVGLCDDIWQSALVNEDDTSPRALSELASFVNGRAFTKDATGAGRMVVRIAELNSGPGGSTVYNEIDVPTEHLARPGDLLFAWSGSLTVHRWYRPEAIVNQHIFKVVPKVGVPTWIVHGGILQLLHFFRGVAADKATTMGYVQRHHLDEQVHLPSAERVAELDRWCGALWERALVGEEESLTLSALRDVLLPKLLSGELDVRDAEDLVSEAV